MPAGNCCAIRPGSLAAGAGPAGRVLKILTGIRRLSWTSGWASLRFNGGAVMAEFPALPLWTDAYLADCGHLSDAEHGRYFLLLMAMWRAPECRLPNDNDWLARRFRRSV